MNCKEFNAHIDDFLDEQLDEGLRKEMEDHQSTCESCAAELMLLQEALAAFSEEPLFSPDENFTRDVMAKVRVMAKFEEEPSFFASLSAIFSDRKFALPAIVGAAAILLAAIFFQGAPTPRESNKGNIVVASAPTSWIHRKMADGTLRPIVLGEQVEVSREAPESIFLSDSRGEIIAASGTILEATKEGVRQVRGSARYDLDLAGERFEVGVKEGTVVVWGTSFQINVRPEETVVKVHEGRVRFEGKTKTVELTVGDTLVATMNSVHTMKSGTESHLLVTPKVTRSAVTAPVAAPIVPSPAVTTPVVTKRPAVATSNPVDEGQEQTGTSGGHKVNVNNTDDLEHIFDK